LSCSVRKRFGIDGRKKISEKRLPVNEITTQKLAEDLKVLINDAEELLKATASETGERIVDLRRRVEQRLAGCQADLAGQGGGWSHKAEQLKACAASCLRDNTWTKVGIAVGVGLVVGLLLRRGPGRSQRYPP
jgi:ElaB/YqjD/DUF883 family membrane-anchored ribosome-binding protein